MKCLGPVSKFELGLGGYGLDYITGLIEANSLKNAAENIWNVAKYHDKGHCRCYASINLFYSEKFVNCLVR